MVYGYEIELSYDIDIIKKTVIENTSEYLVNIEGNRYIYSESKDTSTGLVSYTFGYETYMPKNCEVKIDDSPNIPMMVTLYQVMQYANLPRVRVSGKDTSIIENKREPLQFEEVDPVKVKPQPKEVVKNSIWDKDEFPF